MEEEGPQKAILADGSYGGKEVENFTIDRDLSDRNRTVYVDKDGKAHIAFRGTNLSGASKTKWADLGADALIALGLQDLSARFKGSMRTTRKAIDKYGKENVSVLGHSLGGSQALYVHARTGIDAHAFNPGISPVDVRRSRGVFGPERVLTLFPKRPKYGENAHAYITRGDLISGLAPLVQGLQVHTVPTKVKQNPHALRNFL